MRRLTIALMILIFTGPLLVVGLGWLWMTRQQQAARDSLTAVFASQLREHNRPVETLLQDYEVRMSQALDAKFGSSAQNANDLQTSVDPVIGSFFQINAQGRVVTPTSGEAWLAALLIEQPWLVAPQQESNSVIASNDVQQFANAASQQAQVAVPFRSLPFRTPRSQWTSLFVGPGVQLFYWRQLSDGEIQGVQLRRGRWMSDVIAVLPDSSPVPTDTSKNVISFSRQIRVIDAASEEVYRWGDDNADDWVQLAETFMPPPLSSWRLLMLAPKHATSPLTNGSSRWAILIASASLALALAGLGVYVYRETTRQTRLANQRVSFVGQVSHEFRTPLTNIRLYAELMERAVLDEDTSRKANVIRSEAERLGRLITNVLELSRSGGQRRIQPTTEVPDQVIEHVLESFSPAFAAQQLVVEHQADADRPALLDRDLLEQVLVNLFSNVEKYALSGKYLRVESRQAGDTLTVRVHDHGPGISGKLRTRIFEPFVRGSDAIDAPAGMGIGLAIARSLARAHGGDLRLEAVGQGTCFILQVDAPVSLDEVGIKDHAGDNQ